MSCPDWQKLAAHRQDLDGVEPAEWQEAQLHLESCKECWSEALAADPSLLFRRLPEPTAEDLWDAEVLAVQNAVAAMRTASRLEKAPQRGVLGWNWKEWAAAAALVAAVGGFGSWFELGRPQDEIGAEVAMAPRALPLAVPAAGRIEALDRSYNQVKQLGGTSDDDVSITMFYDPSLDV